MKNLTFMICLFCLLSACESEQTVGQDDGLCFMLKIPLDTIEIDGEMVELADEMKLSLTITGTDVTGTYDYIHVEKGVITGTNAKAKYDYYLDDRKDGMTGELKGTIDTTGKITATYTYIQEGNENSEEIAIELKDNEAIIYDEKLPKVACKDLKPNYNYDGTYKLEYEGESFFEQVFNRLISSILEEKYTKKHSFYRTVIIKKISDSELRFEINVGGEDNCTGELSGVAKLDRLGVAYFSGEDCQQLTFDFYRKTLTVSETACDSFHGMNCYFGGEYMK
jgi:hypothetical protein